MRIYVWMEDREEVTTGWRLLFIISECSIRDISNIICEVAFSEAKIASTKVLTTGYVNLIVLRFLEISDSY